MAGGYRGTWDRESRELFRVLKVEPEHVQTDASRADRDTRERKMVMTDSPENRLGWGLGSKTFCRSQQFRGAWGGSVG